MVAWAEASLGSVDIRLLLGRSFDRMADFWKIDDHLQVGRALGADWVSVGTLLRLGAFYLGLIAPGLEQGNAQGRNASQSRTEGCRTQDVG